MKISNDVCKTIKDLSREIWNLYRTAKKSGMSLREETFTELTLVELIRRIPDTYVKTKPFSTKQENLNGSDWEWFIIEDNKVVRYRVQGKKLHFQGRKYCELAHPVKIKDANDVVIGEEYQWDRLVREAHKSTPQAIPIYSFYNYLEKEELNEVLPEPPSGVPLDFELLGWTFCYAETIYPVADYKLKKFPKFFKESCSKPMYQLFCGKSLDEMTEAYNQCIIDSDLGGLDGCVVKFPLKDKNGNDINKPKKVRPADISELPGFAVDILPEDIQNKLEEKGIHMNSDKNEFEYNTDFVVVTVLSSEFSAVEEYKENVAKSTDQLKKILKLIFGAVKKIWERTTKKERV